MATIVAAARVSRADSPILTAEVVGQSIQVRSGAPITVVWKLKSQSSQLLEGRLELTIKDGHERLARVATDEIVLNTSEQLYRMVLPTLDTTHNVNAVEMSLRFVGPHGTIDLGHHSNLRLPGSFQRAHVIAISDPWQTTLSHDKRAFIDQFRVEAGNFDRTDRTLSTSMAHIPPDAMPADPLGCLGFDLVLLMNEGFADLRDSQLQAILSWVDAGGSLAIVPGRHVVRKEHVEFLNKIATGAAASPFELDPTGRISPASADSTAPNSAGDRPILLKRYGMGRAAIVRAPLDSLGAAAETEIRRMQAFLWKMRADRRAEFEANGVWDVRDASIREAAALADPNLAPQVQSQMIAQLRPRDMQLAPFALQSGDQLLARIMPRHLKVVPLSLVMFMLFLYVLTIGPGDYWLLGALKRRRYTWILFPAVTIGFAVGTVWLSNWYMRVADNRRSVTFLDIGETGSVARRNRFDLLFRATQGDVVTRMQRGLFTAMNHQQYSRGSWYTYQQAMRRGDENQLDLVAVPKYEGRVPVRYTATQFIPQWTPQLNRSFSVVTDESDPPVEFDWKSLAPLTSAMSTFPLHPEARRQISGAVLPKFGPEASIYVVTGQRLQHVAGQDGLLQRDDPELSAVPVTPYNAMGSRSNTTFLLDVCTGWPHGGLFNVVSQISPNGGTDFDDMALVDPSDPRQWLLIVMVDRGDELVVYRKLYTGE